MSKETTFTTVGGLLPRDFLDRVGAGDRSLPGTEPTSYDLVPGERLNDAITRSWNRLRPLWDGFVEALAAQPETDLTATTITRQRWLMPLLDELGFGGGLEHVRGLKVEGKSYPISHRWGGHVPVHLPGARIPIDKITRGVPGAPLTSPHGLVQEFLNRSDSDLWALLSNGLQLRLLRDNASLTRQAYIEFDLEATFNGDSYADFCVLWLTCHRTRFQFEGEVVEKCLLEQWANEAAASGTRALDNLRSGVEDAITTLGEGFLVHPANKHLREALRTGALDATDYNHQILRTIYRILFLLVAEGRNLLLDPAADPVSRANYNKYYSITRIRTLSTQRRGSSHDDLWQALGVVFSALSHSGQPALALQPLGSYLWSPQATSALADARLDNAHMLQALRQLGQVRDPEAKVVRNVDYRNLGAEELGSVYESLLELHPEVDVDARRFNLSTAAGNERKTTGSYYTPTGLINELLDSALEPVLREAAASPNPEEAILALSVLDPACGSGHFLIAAAHRIAHRLASVRAEGAEPSPEQVRSSLRDVVGRCIHGIDINPMAVELCKVSLWLEAMEPGKPLNFLEHRIICGNALLGTTPRLLDAGIPGDAFKALTGDDKTIVSALKKRNKTEQASGGGTQGTFELGGVNVAAASTALVAEAIAAIDALPDSTVEEIETKQRLLAQHRASDAARHARLAADAWCTAFVTLKQEDEPQVTSATIDQLLQKPASVPQPIITRVEELADHYQFLHLHLAFPDVIEVPAHSADATNERTGWSGGFDIILGNPPWERVKLQEKEWFATREPEIASASNAAARKKKIVALIDEDPELHTQFQAAIRQAEGESHLLRDSGRYPLCGRGDVNTYTVFTELMRDTAAPTGRVGTIVPSGIATDDTTKFFFQAIVENRNLTNLFDFENSKPIFLGVHRSYKFCLLTLSGDGRPNDEAEFVFFATDTADLNDPERRFTLTPEDFSLINPNTKTCPIFRTRRDAEITKSIYRRIPVLDGVREASEWMVRLWAMLHSKRDGDFLVQDIEDDGRVLPVYEAKMAGTFDHRAADIVISPSAISRPAQPRSISDDDKASPIRRAEAHFEVPLEAARERVRNVSQRRWLLGWRDVTSATNARTLLVTPLPPTPCLDTILGIEVCDPMVEPLDLVAVLASFAIDFVVRQKVGSNHIKFHHMRQFPVPGPNQIKKLEGLLSNSEKGGWVTERALELSYTAWDMESLGRSLACLNPPFRWEPERRELLRAELDGAFFHLYGVGRDDVDYIMDSFPIVRSKDEAEYGEYRTKRLILKVYDRMAEAIESGEPYQTLLDPPPGDPSLCHDPSTRPDWADLYLELAEGNDTA